MILQNNFLIKKNSKNCSNRTNQIECNEILRQTNGNKNQSKDKINRNKQLLASIISCLISDPETARTAPGLFYNLSLLFAVRLSFAPRLQ